MTVGIVSVPVQPVRAAYIEVGYSPINVLLPQPALSTNFVDVAALRPNIDTINITTTIRPPEWVPSTVIPQPALSAGSDTNALRPNQNMNVSPMSLQGPAWIPAVTIPQPVLFAGSDINALLANQNKNISPISLQGPIWLPSTPLPRPAFSPLQIPYPYPPTVIFNEQYKINQSINVEQGIWERILKQLAVLISFNLIETKSIAEALVRKIFRTAGSIVYEDFSANSTYNFANDGDISPDGLIVNGFRGGGTAGVKLDGVNVFYQIPATATSSGQTFASRSDTVQTWTTDQVIEVKVKTISQLRTGSAPNNWEVAWLFFNYIDATHVYYFTQKISGIEFGKNDSVGVSQQILFTAGSPSITLGTYNVWKVTIKNGNHFIITVDGTQVMDYTDNAQSVNYNGVARKVAMYCEDSNVEFAYINVTTLEDTNILESQLRKAIPKIVAETKSITSTLLRTAIPKILTETKTIAETLLRKPIPKVVTETETISETQLRKPIPKITTEIETISEALAHLNKFKRVFTETKSISETQLRKPIPKITTQSTSISETQLRKAIPKIVSETVAIAETQLRKVIPKLATQTTAISESLVRLVHFFRTITETNTISETLVAIWKFFYSITETVSISETQLRKVIPKLATQTTTISESLLRKVMLTITETKSIVETQLRTVIPKIIAETKSIADALSAVFHAGGGGTLFSRSITETISISETELRNVIPKITAQTVAITETLLRTIVEEFDEILLISDSIIKGAFRPLAQTVTISEVQLRTVIPSVVAETTAISDSIVRLGKHFRTLTQTTTLTETQLRKAIPRIITEVKSITDSIKRRMIPTISDSVVITDSLSRLANHFIMIRDAITIIDRVFGWLVGTVRRVVRIQTCN